MDFHRLDAQRKLVLSDGYYVIGEYPPACSRLNVPPQNARNADHGQHVDLVTSLVNGSEQTRMLAPNVGIAKFPFS